MGLRAGRGGAGTGRHLAQNQPRIVLEGHLAQLDVPSRPLMAGFDIVGRRLDLHRRTGPACKWIPAPPWLASEGCSPRPRRHTTRPPGALTRGSWLQITADNPHPNARSELAHQRISNEIAPTPANW